MQKLSVTSAGTVAPVAAGKKQQEKPASTKTKTADAGLFMHYSCLSTLSFWNTRYAVAGRSPL